MFGGMIFEELTVYIIYTPDVVVINPSYIIKSNANCFGVDCEQVACPSPSAGRYLIITQADMHNMA